MNYGDYLFETDDEISLTDKLLLMDRALMQVHHDGKFVSSNLLDAYIINDKIDPSSIESDVFDPEKNDKDYAQDIMELAAIGICAYNRFGESEGIPKYFTSPEFIASLTDINQLEMYLNRADIPEEVKNYYRSVFTLFDIKYMTNYLMEQQKNGGKGTEMVKSYSTPEGRAFANNQEQNGFAPIISIPAVLAIVYIISMLVIILVKVLK